MTLETPLLQQNGSYSAGELRKLVRAALPGLGVIESSDLVVLQRQAGANMSVDVWSGSVVVEASTSSRGRYLCRSTSVENLELDPAPGAGTSRIDLVVARVYDSEYGDAGDSFALEVVTGTAGSSPSVPATPGSSIELARVTVSSSTSSVTDSIIADRRPFARAVTYVNVLPAVAENGQVLVSSIGVVNVRENGEWTALPHKDQFAGKETSFASVGFTNAYTSIHSHTLDTDPSGPHMITATFHGSVTASSGAMIADVRVDVSWNDGASWESGDVVNATTTNAYDAASISCGIVRSQLVTRNRPRVRVVAKELSGNGTITGHLITTMTPA